MKRIVFGVISLFLIIICVSFPVKIYAADAVVIFGSDSYEKESGEEFPIGVYIDGDSEIGYYKVEIEYDRERLKYLEGASDEKDGKLIFEGVGNDTEVSTMLRFEALSGGNTQIKISDARVLVADSDNELFEITEKAAVPIVLKGEDVVAAKETEETTESETQEETQNTTQEKEENKTDITKSEFFWPLVMIIGLGAVLATIMIMLGVRKSNRRKAAKADAKRNVREKLGAETSGKPGLYEEKQPAKVTVTNKINTSEPEKVTTPERGGEIKKESVSEKKNSQTKPDVITGDLKTAVKEKNTNAHLTNGLAGPQVYIEQPVFKKVRSIINKTEKVPVIKGEPVIQVNNVSMTFKVSNSNVSGLKDYAIQKVKGGIKNRMLKALDNVSFDIYKGEVVGIIGTNGSGKSTLLKIVSGALRPTSGEVIADKKKIQLLTLGTGFDGELSARENVYLNGAIIGYSKEFIDEHYDEIVRFAELEDFMEEKVKNFSSGMVSRLGFSIATVAGVAEILILDEVLAVGDQFFRKKSLERVKEMIHGGSTVLIVSHNMGTIREHCNKVIWLEKGVLKMVGSPKDVCTAYVKSHEKTVGNQ